MDQDRVNSEELPSLMAQASYNFSFICKFSREENVTLFSDCKDKLRLEEKNLNSGNGIIIDICRSIVTNPGEYVSKTFWCGVSSALLISCDDEYFYVIHDLLNKNPEGLSEEKVKNVTSHRLKQLCDLALLNSYDCSNTLNSLTDNTSDSIAGNNTLNSLTDNTSDSVAAAVAGTYRNEVVICILIISLSVLLVVLSFLICKVRRSRLYPIYEPPLKEHNTSEESPFKDV